MLSLPLLSLAAGAHAATRSFPLHRRSALVPDSHLHPHKRAVRFADDDEKRAAFERLGREAERVRRKYGKALAGSVAASSGLDERASADVQIFDADQDLEYFVTVQIGTPAQPINVTVDTGSADLWIPSSSCSAGCASNQTFYDPTASSSFANTTTSITVQYGSGSVQGALGYDTITLGDGLAVSHSGVIVAQVVEGLLESDVPVSGLMGFGWQTISESQTTPYWQAVLANGTSSTSFDQPAFGIALARAPGARTDQAVAGEVDSGGSFILGGWDESAISGGSAAVEWNSLVEEGYWQINVASVGVNGATVSGTGTTAAIDTGTTLIAAPTTLVQQVYSNIPQGQVITGGNGLWAYPYQETANVSITFGSQAWPISADDFCYYSFTATSSGTEGTWCVGAIFDGGSSLAASTVPDWIIGDAYMKNVYTIFRASPAAVGFGALAGGSAPTSPSGTTGSAASGTSVIVSNGVTYTGSAQTAAPSAGGEASAAPALGAVVPAAVAGLLAIGVGAWCTL